MGARNSKRSAIKGQSSRPRFVSCFGNKDDNNHDHDDDVDDNSGGGGVSMRVSEPPSSSSSLPTARFKQKGKQSPQVDSRQAVVRKVQDSLATLEGQETDICLEIEQTETDLRNLFKQKKACKSKESQQARVLTGQIARANKKYEDLKKQRDTNSAQQSNFNETLNKLTQHDHLSDHLAVMNEANVELSRLNRKMNPEDITRQVDDMHDTLEEASQMEEAVHLAFNPNGASSSNGMDVMDSDAEMELEQALADLDDPAPENQQPSQQQLFEDDDDEDDLGYETEEVKHTKFKDLLSKFPKVPTGVGSGGNHNHNEPLAAQKKQQQRRMQSQPLLTSGQSE